MEGSEVHCVGLGSCGVIGHRCSNLKKTRYTTAGLLRSQGLELDEQIRSYDPKTNKDQCQDMFLGRQLKANGGSEL